MDLDIRKALLQKLARETLDLIYLVCTEIFCLRWWIFVMSCFFNALSVCNKKSFHLWRKDSLLYRMLWWTFFGHNKIYIKEKCVRGTSVNKSLRLVHCFPWAFYSLLSYVSPTSPQMPPKALFLRIWIFHPKLAICCLQLKAPKVPSTSYSTRTSRITFVHKN